MKQLNDERVAKALGWKAEPRYYNCAQAGFQTRWWSPNGKDYGNKAILPKWTTSLDAIVAEVEARGLEWSYNPRGYGYGKKNSVGISKDWDDEKAPLYEAEAETPALALCAALLQFLKETPNAR